MVVGEPSSLIELVTELGHACLSDERLLATNMKNPAVSKSVEYLAALVGATNPAAWQQPPAGGFATLLDTQEVHTILSELRSLDPVSHLGILRGLCAGALELFFEGFRGRVRLKKGMPIPHATRPVQKLFGTRCAPYRQTITARELLGRTGYDLFHETDPKLSVTLDLSCSEKLDALTWSAEGLPHVGTVHPRLDGDRLSYSLTGDRVFDVGPKDWSLEETLDHLETVKAAKITLLPELCLPSPHALQEALASDPSRYSPIVVAGSAHDRIDENGTPSSINESRVYIEGEHVLSHKKIRPLETHQIGNHRSVRMVREDLSPTQDEIVLLSGEKTRMAVAICADINDGAIPRVLEECGVNLLLVPSLTYKTGAFNGAACLLASKCQALCVVANPILDQLEGEPQAPFLLLAAVPCSGASEQSQEYFHPPVQTAVRGVLDPNLPLASVAALRWV
jgi:hypothetical protein